MIDRFWRVRKSLLQMRTTGVGRDLADSGPSVPRNLQSGAEGPKWVDDGPAATRPSQPLEGLSGVPGSRLSGYARRPDRPAVGMGGLQSARF